MNTTQTTPPPPAADPAPSPEALPTPLSPLRDRLDDLIEALALDWDDPSLSAGRLCKLYHLKPEQLAAIAQLPRFRAIIASLETLRAERTATLDARIREDLRAVLLRLVHQDPTNPAIAKEIRLATKQLAALTGENRPSRRKTAPRGGGADPQSAIPETPPMKSADSSPPSLSPEQTDTPTPTQDTPSPALQARQDPNSTPDPTPTLPPSGGVGAAAPTPQPTQSLSDNPKPRPNPHKPKSPRGYKTRPKSKSR